MAELVAVTRDVSRETSERLLLFVELLRKWNTRINLVAPSTLGDVWNRHILDSAQLLGLVSNDVKDWIDLGTGGGFPGLVVAILAAENRPDLEVTLVEADQRKAAFLREAARVTDVRVAILAQRVETLPEMRFDIVSSRALTSVEDLLAFAARLLRPNGSMLLLKGRGFQSEIDRARQKWSFSLEQSSSASGADGAVLQIRDVRHV